MSLFQRSVEKKYLNELDSERIDIKYTEFQNYFGNPERQENIRNSKEEQFQEGFLRELFVKILGYTLNPEPNFNLTTELKNISNSKKADGAILKGEDATAVIELKGTDTTDLDKIETQAFGYKNHHPKCKYVITSNFEKIRFYIQNAVDHVDFDLFNLTRSQFSILWLCLAKDNLLTDLPLKMKESSVLQEENITKKLYADYSKFREAIYNNLVKNNPETDKLLLFKKTQKLLDRFLFIFFAEDRLLLPPNSISEIVKQWTTLKDELDEYVPLYARFKKYFGYMNSGYKGKKYDIYAYNGGLFKPDEILDNINIDDDILHEHTLRLSNYDFETDVDVNILGHIFEHSLGEIENVQAEIKGERVDSQKTKRKKDGIFYTPKYITKYMVENTVGKLCDKKRSELEIVDEEYAKGRKNRKKDIVRALDRKLDDYRNWLLTLTILDPACGSGAFLNQALEFLINEHRKIDELRGQLLGGAIIFSDITTDILEKNIYGVDLNEESVEIAKLSLWLRTAQKGRKLNTLSNNIKCGNSLIDDPKNAGEKAFNWQKEFPAVFTNGGFDVVIGNPPYVQLQSMGAMSETLAMCGFETFHKGADLYCLFTERGYKLLKNGGMQSFIMPNKWMIVAYGKPLRKFLAETGLRQILNFGDIQFFEEATTYVCIFVIQNGDKKENVKVLSLNNKTYNGDFLSEVTSNLYEYPATNFGDDSWSIQPYADAQKLQKMAVGSTKLKDLPISIYRGILTGYNDAFFIDEDTRKKLIVSDKKSGEIIKPMLRGRNISAYGITGSEYLIGTFPSLGLDIENFPAIKEHLLSFGYDRLNQTGEKGSRKKTSGQWFETQDSIAYFEEFSKPKIMYPNMTSVFPFLYDESGFLSNDKSFIITAQDESVSLLFLTALFNSSLAKLWIWYNCPELQGGTREIRKVFFEHFPVPHANKNQISTMEQQAIRRTQLTKDLQSTSLKFQRAIQRNFSLESLSNNLQNWYSLSFADFEKELRKKKIKLSLTQEAEWEDYFLAESGKANTFSNQIREVDEEIDQVVYEVYGLVI
ncbi:Eco57I restriction-modification methylase domain-containing protein [uncultured Draconibacterium sp.]|uniref:Eco57I restriction-modification methylase domain-containing protein n=1 Tax=uncultured Draconibacterium sp. TaxID=1573823 RepID=UPI0029C8FDD2|nr:N-6 DNA methylase [uncultured Draconibacterium sp.]